MLTLLQTHYLSFFKWVMISSAKASIFVIFLLAVKFVLRYKMGARFQYGLWSVLLLGLLLPWTPNSPASLYNFLDSSRMQQIIAALVDRAAQSASGHVNNQPSGLEPVAAVGASSDQTAISPENQLFKDKNAHSKSVSLSAYKLMSYIWLSGVLVWTVLTVIINKRFAKSIGQALVTDQVLLAEFQKLQAELQVKREIPLLKSRHVTSPSLAGLIQPKLLLPFGIEQTFSREQVMHIFLHELIHFKRKDIWINCLGQALLIGHWFNPLLWYAFYRMREDQEMACDALAALRLNHEQSYDYAHTLLKLAETYNAVPRIAGLSGLCGSNSQIKKRLIMLGKRKQIRASAKWSLLGALMIGLIALATFSSAQAEKRPVSEEGRNIKLSAGNSQGQTSGAAERTVDIGPGVIIEDIAGPNYKGKVMLIKDPTRVKLAITKEIGVTGEKVSELVKDRSALAGINGGAFLNQNGQGKGGLPDGLAVQDGKVVANNVGDQAVNIVGFDDQGKMILGSMTAKEVEARHILEAVSFVPNLIVEGKSLISGDGGWGIAPRTGIGQKADGTVIFVVIDGRQPGWSMGATLRELTQVFEDYGAVQAVNLDGGSSSEMVYQGKVINKPGDIFGERYVPTAFVVTS